MIPTVMLSDPGESAIVSGFSGRFVAQLACATRLAASRMSGAAATDLATSGISLSSHTPSQPSTTSRTTALATDSIAGVQITGCCETGLPAGLNAKSPKARVTASLPSTRPFSSETPSAATRSHSLAFLPGVWSCVMLATMAPSASVAAMRQSPALHRCTCEWVSTAQAAVLPLAPTPPPSRISSSQRWNAAAMASRSRATRPSLSPT
mmetsp:Transcript_3599/g.11260  ORF Transcript_3599/g.11260 Transcript_3599/m.11260 type:complete len:208 (-) Transcript_3599:957-1580(-)